MYKAIHVQCTVYHFVGSHLSVEVCRKISANRNVNLHLKTGKNIPLKQSFDAFACVLERRFSFASIFQCEKDVH